VDAHCDKLVTVIGGT